LRCAGYPDYPGNNSHRRVHLSVVAFDLMVAAFVRWLQLHHCDHAFRVPEVLHWLSNAGLRLVRGLLFITGAFSLVCNI
jgi:hypothetical protein